MYLVHFVELFLLESLEVGFVPNQGSLFTAAWNAYEASTKQRDIVNLLMELTLASRQKLRERQI
jgi:hypothetical protein